jgi:putative transposase
LYEARKRFGLCVLNYQVTCNHAHLLVLDRGRDEIAPSMQLIAGRSGQDFNRRKKRRGAFWEDRYHATAIDSDGHLARCLVYIDLNMVRAGAVEHPQQWREAGYHEIQRPREAYRIVDRAALSELLAVSEDRLARVHAEWVRAKLAGRDRAREPEWSTAIAIGRRAYVEEVQYELGSRGRYRRIEEENGSAVLREPDGLYAPHLAVEMTHLSGKISLS